MVRVVRCLLRKLTTRTRLRRTVGEPVDDVERVDEDEGFEEDSAGVVDNPDSAEWREQRQPPEEGAW